MIKQSFDTTLFANVSINELINSCDAKSDTDTLVSSDKESIKSDENLSDEEARNKYSFLDSFKKRRKKPRRVPVRPLIEERYTSD